MAEDRKFKFENGTFVNRVSGEAIPDDEPVVLFRARDVHAISVLQHYYSLVRDEHHEQAIWERLNEFIEFKALNPERMKEPGITHHIELSISQRKPSHIIIPENAEREEADEMRHEGAIEERLGALEHREHNVEKEMKKIMADIDTLNSVLGGIATDATQLSADFKNLEAELQAAQEAAANNQPIDLTSSILMARNAQAALDAIVQSAATPAAAPTGATGGAAPVGGDTSGAPVGGDTSGAPVGGDTSGPPVGGDTSGAPVGGDTTGTGGDTSGAPAA